MFNIKVSGKKNHSIISFLIICSLLFPFLPVQQINAISTPNTLTTSDIKTPKNTNIQAYKVTGEFTPTQISQSNTEMDAAYPHATRKASATGKYNCHSYAWYLQSTSNIYWMDQNTSSGGANLSKYWTDGSYTLAATISDGLINPHSVTNGCKVFFYNSDHSAIVWNATLNTLRAKWGDYGVYEHSTPGCPYPDTQNLKVYK